MPPMLCLACCSRPLIFFPQCLLQECLSQDDTRGSAGGDSHPSHSTLNISRPVSVSLSVVLVHLSITDVLKLTTSTLS